MATRKTTPRAGITLSTAAKIHQAVDAETLEIAHDGFEDIDCQDQRGEQEGVLIGAPAFDVADGQKPQAARQGPLNAWR